MNPIAIERPKNDYISLLPELEGSAMGNPVVSKEHLTELFDRFVAQKIAEMKGVVSQLEKQAEEAAAVVGSQSRKVQ